MFPGIFGRVGLRGGRKLIWREAVLWKWTIKKYIRIIHEQPCQEAFWDLHLLGVRGCQCCKQYRLHEECDKFESKRVQWQRGRTVLRQINKHYAAFTCMSLRLYSQQNAPRPWWHTGSGRTSCSVCSHSRRWHLFPYIRCISSVECGKSASFLFCVSFGLCGSVALVYQFASSLDLVWHMRHGETKQVVKLRRIFAKNAWSI